MLRCEEKKGCCLVVVEIMSLRLLENLLVEHFFEGEGYGEGECELSSDDVR